MSVKRIVIAGFLLFATTLFAFGEGRTDSVPVPIQQSFKLNIHKATSQIHIDGELNESDWANAQVVTAFWKKYPSDEGMPKYQSLVKTTYDDKNLYFAVELPDSGKQFIRTLKRDGGHDGSDGFGIILDPLNQHTNGFFFVVNAYNSQSEDQLGGGNEPTFSWDNKWFSATKRLNNKWVAEVAIPFKTLRYKSDQKTWGINFVRIETKTNEYSTWTKMPVNIPSFDLGYTGALQWDSAPPVPGGNVVVLPYVTGTLQSDNESGKQAYKVDGNAGFDAKIGLGSSLNLDLTVNPDFSQIEVDKQVTNLTRYNIFLPERRTFFLENEDLFSGYGIPPIRPFYSRTIGLDSKGNRIPIIGGARVTGNITSSTRIGIMNMQTGSKGDYKGENFTAASVNQRVFDRSVIKGYFLNRQGFLSEAEKAKDPLAAYGRNAGLQFDYSNLNGSIQAWGAYHASMKPTIHDKNSYVDVGFVYNVRKFNAVIDVVNVGTNYYTDLGYVERISNYDADRDTSIRVGFKHIYNQYQYRIFPKSKRINTIRLNNENYIVWNPNNSLNETNHSLMGSIEFKNTSVLINSLNFSKVNLLYPISFTGDKPLPKDSYNYLNNYLGYESDYRKKFGYGGSLVYGGFYNGSLLGVKGSFTFRHPPHVSLTMQAEYNRLSFPGEYGRTTIVLISPRVDINFTTSIFWTTFFQYNTQANNFNINSRFQWRFRPMSDLYLVYTDNYFTDPLLKNKTRALVLKVNYWINI